MLNLKIDNLARAVIIANKRLQRESEHACTFSTRAYLDGLVVLQKKGVMLVEEGYKLKVNDTSNNPAKRFVIRGWLWQKIKAKLAEMREDHYKYDGIIEE